jgi:hypothetical protein
MFDNYNFGNEVFPCGLVLDLKDWTEASNINLSPHEIPSLEQAWEFVISTIEKDVYLLALNYLVHNL